MNFAGALLTVLFTMLLILPLVLVLINNAKIEGKKAIEKQKELESAYKELESAYKELEYSKKAISDLEFELHQEHNDFSPSSSFSAETNLNSSAHVYTPTQTEIDEKEKLICSISSYRDLAEDYLKNQNYSKAIEILKQRNGFIMDPKLFQHWRFSGSPEYELMRLPIAYMMNRQPEIADKEAEKIKDFLKTLHANNQLENFNYILYCSRRDDKDLVYLPTKKELENGVDINAIDRKRIYKFVSASGTTADFVPVNSAKTIFTMNKKKQEECFGSKDYFRIQDEYGVGSPQSKNQKAITGEMIKEICVPIKVDRLGEIIEFNGNKV